MSANGGGPAFPGPAYMRGRGNFQPVIFPDGTVEWQEMAPGMELRDWFAGQALQGFFACPDPSTPCREEDKGRVARHCYIYADAMLAARERKEEP